MDTKERRGSDTGPPARTDLSHLPEDVRLRIAVAEALGAIWRPRSQEWLTDPRRPRLRELAFTEGAIIARESSGGWPVAYDGPDYLNDPAAWGNLVERERISVRWVEIRGMWCADSIMPGYSGHWADTPGRAICLAFLAKKGITWPDGSE